MATPTDPTPAHPQPVSDSNAFLDAAVDPKLVEEISAAVEATFAAALNA